ncbi:hypothetical protein Fmac_028216 [Flemingia macrophylla]|uniref:Uncharacterized protein n=1 Tax=Flemingia macrophylla TaxID=520843 RepID=A0ABD1L6V9_9FABA
MEEDKNLKEKLKEMQKQVLLEKADVEKNTYVNLHVGDVIRFGWSDLTGCNSLPFKANFVVNNEKHEQYILGSLGNKWKDKCCRLFDKYHNWEQFVEENIHNHPPHIPQDHWAIVMRYKRSTKAMGRYDHTEIQYDRNDVHFLAMAVARICIRLRS